MRLEILSPCMIGLLICFAVVLVMSPVSAITLASKGKARATIILGSDATKTEQYAANQLSEYLGKATGAKFSISDTPSIEGSSIYIGQTASVKKRLGAFDWSSLNS